MTQAQGLSNPLDGDISHHHITAFLSRKQYSSVDLWKNVKKESHEIESEEAVLIFDDPFKRNLITVKMNLLAGTLSIALAAELKASIY